MHTNEREEKNLNRRSTQIKDEAQMNAKNPAVDQLCSCGWSVSHSRLFVFIRGSNLCLIFVDLRPFAVLF
jgi:hypothetical protein